MNRSTKTFITIIFIFVSLLFWNDVDSSVKKFKMNEKIKLMTYNIYGYRMIHQKRTEALIKLIEKSDAHIIALQEAKPWFLKRLLKRPLIKLRYKHTPISKWYDARKGLIIFSQFPIINTKYIRLPGRKNQLGLLAKVRIDNDIVPVVNVHLESYLWSGKLRKLQLRKIFDKVKWHHNAIVLGDFNFGDAEVESKAIPGKYTDLWLSLKRNRKGFTWDMERNILARNHAYEKETSRRLDRILVKNNTWEPVKIKIVGKKPIYLDEGKIHPSDHFALLGTIKRI